MDMPFGSQILGIYVQLWRLATSVTFAKAKFHRLFIVLLPAEHPSHHNFGVPEYYEQLTLKMGNHIEISKLSPHIFCSAGVTLGPESGRCADW